MDHRGGIVPHVVLKGPIEIDEVFRRLKPVFVKTERGILKATDAYMDRAKRSILIDAMSIEAGETVRFLMMIVAHEDGIEVRMFDVPEVPASDSIRMVMAETAKQLLETFEELELGETNLIKHFNVDGPD
jgi:hypothetical protein